MTDQPNRADRRRAWPKRRAWSDRIAHDDRLTSGCKAWLGLLASRSDDTGKPVWGRQTRMAEQLGRSDRSVRSYRQEAEELGYVKTYRAKPQRGRDGRWGRRRTNRYYITLPVRETATQPAPRRRQRVPYCVVPATRLHAPHLPETDRRSNPFRVPPTTAHPPPDIPTAPPEPENPPAHLSTTKPSWPRCGNLSANRGATPPVGST
jgi:hypothetical protein